MNWFKKYFKNYSPKAHCSSQLLKKGVAFAWKEEHENAFYDLKQSLLNSVSICATSYYLPLMYNASTCGVLVGNCYWKFCRLEFYLPQNINTVQPARNVRPTSGWQRYEVVTSCRCRPDVRSLFCASWFFPYCVFQAQSIYILFEHASGYALFSVKEFEEVGMLLPQVEEGVKDISKFMSVVKLAAFSPFKTGTNALDNMNSISEGKDYQTWVVLQKSCFITRWKVGKHLVQWENLFKGDTPKIGQFWVILGNCILILFKKNKNVHFQSYMMENWNSLKYSMHIAFVQNVAIPSPPQPLTLSSRSQA